LLLSPFENVSVATVLRSPIFAATDDELLALAAIDDGSHWYDSLLRHYGNDAVESTLARAARLLQTWRGMADRIPVHDLLDLIYYEGNVSERYESAAPAHLRARVAANLTRLLDLALEADSGRFPSLARFLSRLQLLTEEDNESLGGTESAADQVRLLTIHGAKGLESPVVFLADAARDTAPRERGLDVLVDWPMGESRPANFLLRGRGSDADHWSRSIADRQAAAAFQEETNLLYVALTRAQQYLFVSGCESGRRRNEGPGRAGDEARGWYGYIERRLARAQTQGDDFAADVQVQKIPAADGDEPMNICGSITYGSAPVLVPEQTPLALTMSIDRALTRPFAAADTVALLADIDEDTVDLTTTPEVEQWPAAKRRGVIVHRMLERLTASGVSRERARAHAWHEYGSAIDDDVLQACWREACAVLDATELAPFFDNRNYDEARNEVAVLYEANGESITGVVDRLLISRHQLTLIDYKTDRVKTDEIPAFVSRYTPQLRRYADGLRRLWPNRRIAAVLLLTQRRLKLSVDV
jgi:ATP-dependent helicase/nuclease subunit A